MAEKTLNTIIVLRNDQTTAWEESSHVMKKGELGVAYTADGKVIVKAGDGVKTWKALPQVEGVFEDDLTLTYAFGKYTPDSTGSFVLNTAGKTMSEVMLDAFAQEVYADLITSRPTASFSVSGGGSAEVGETHGSPKATLDLTATGTYKYSAKDADGNVEQADIKFTEAHIKYDGNKVAELAASNPNADLTYTLTLSGDALKYKDETDTYKFYGTAKHGDDVNRPLTNLGNFVGVDAEGKNFGTKDFEQATGYITGATVVNNQEKSVSYTGYRKMFMGVVTADPAEVNSAFIRGLNKVSEKAAKTSKEFTAAAGSKSFYVAVPTSLTTAEPTFQYKFFGNWEALGGVAALDGTVDVEGANSFEAKPYKVYKYTPATGSFEANTDIKVTVK